MRMNTIIIQVSHILISNHARLPAQLFCYTSPCFMIPCRGQMRMMVYRRQESLPQCMHPQKAATSFICKRTGQNDLIACRYSILQISALVLPFYIFKTEKLPSRNVQPRLRLRAILSAEYAPPCLPAHGRKSIQRSSLA